MVRYLISPKGTRLSPTITENLKNRLYDWIPVIIAVFHDQVPLNNIKLFLEFIKHNVTSYDALYTAGKALFDNIGLDDWINEEVFDYEPLVDVVIQALQDEGYIQPGVDSDRIAERMRIRWESLTG